MQRFVYVKYVAFIQGHTINKTCFVCLPHFCVIWYDVTSETDSQFMKYYKKLTNMALFWMLSRLLSSFLKFWLWYRGFCWMKNRAVQCEKKELLRLFLFIVMLSHWNIEHWTVIPFFSGTDLAHWLWWFVQKQKLSSQHETNDCWPLFPSIQHYHFIDSRELPNCVSFIYTIHQLDDPWTGFPITDWYFS